MRMEGTYHAGRSLCRTTGRDDSEGCEATRVRRVRQDRRRVGPFAHLPTLRHHPVLRQLTQSPRFQACAGAAPYGHRLRRARRALAVLLSARHGRRILIAGTHLPSHDVVPFVTKRSHSPATHWLREVDDRPIGATASSRLEHGSADDAGYDNTGQMDAGHAADGASAAADRPPASCSPAGASGPRWAP